MIWILVVAMGIAIIALAAELKSEKELGELQRILISAQERMIEALRRKDKANTESIQNLKELIEILSSEEKPEPPKEENT
jgi:uncharacterized membrane protein (DUF106 family)